MIQVKALEAEVINLRKEIELMRNQHQLVDRQRLKAIQVSLNIYMHIPLTVFHIFLMLLVERI